MLQKDTQRYQKIRKKLDAFKNAQEWSDFISLLTAVDNALIKVETLPKDIEKLLTRRLNQSLNYALPAGVHNKALETYEIIINRIPLSKHLTLGLFSYGIYSKLSVRSNYLHVLSLLRNKHVDNKSRILGLLPFLEEENNELFEPAAKLIDEANDFDAIWQNFLLCPELRIAIINYFKNRKVTISDILIKSIQKTLFEADNLTIRGTLDLLNNDLKLNDLIRYFNPDISKFEMETVVHEQKPEDLPAYESIQKTTSFISSAVDQKEKPQYRIIIEDDYLHDEIIKLTIQILSLYLRKEVTINKKVNLWLQNDKNLQKMVLKRIIDTDLDLFYKLFQNLIVQDEISDKEIIDLLLRAIFKTRKKSRGFDIIFSLLETSFFWKVLWIEFRRIINEQKNIVQFNQKIDKNTEKIDKNDGKMIENQIVEEKDKQVLKNTVLNELENGENEHKNTDEKIRFDEKEPLPSNTIGAVLGEKIPKIEENDENQKTIVYNAEHTDDEQYHNKNDKNTEYHLHSSVHTEKSENSIDNTKVKGGQSVFLSSFQNYSEYIESEKQLSVKDLSRTDISEDAKVDTNDLLDLVSFLFKKKNLSEETENFHALHMLLLICLNHSVFETQKLNETIGLLLEAIDMQHAGKYIENYRNLFHSKRELKENQENQGKNEDSIQLPPTLKIKNDDDFKALIEEKLDEFYVNNGSPVELMYFDNISLQNEILTVIVKYVNPFDIDFWKNYIAENDLKEVFFILRRVLKNKTLHSLKKEIFHKLFYKYDEKLFLAYEMIFEKGFEDLMIEEIQKEKIFRIIGETKDDKNLITQKELSQKNCFKILEYSFNVLNIIRFYRTLNIIANRDILVFLCSLDSTVLFDKILDDSNIFLFEKMLRYNHKFTKHLKKGINAFDLCMNKIIKYASDSDLQKTDEYGQIITIIKKLIEMNLVQNVKYREIYENATLQFYFDSSDLMENILRERSTHDFFLTHYPLNNVIFKIKNQDFLRRFYLRIIDEYHKLCKSKVSLNKNDDQNVSELEEQGEQYVKNAISSQKIDFLLLLEVLKQIQKKKLNYDMDEILQKVMFICSEVYEKKSSHSEPLILDTIYGIEKKDNQLSEHVDFFTFKTIINSIFEILIYENSFINIYVKYFSIKLPLNEKLERKIFQLILQKGKYAYLNKVFNQKITISKPVTSLKDVVDINDLKETELITIRNISMDSIQVRSVPYFNYFFDEKISQVKKIETLSHLYFLMSNMSEHVHSRRLLELCLIFLYKLLQNKKKMGTNLLRVCLRNCNVPLTERLKTQMLNICIFLIKRENEVVIDKEKYNYKNKDLLPHYTNEQFENKCKNCNDLQNIGLDALIYHNIGEKDFFDYFLESGSFFKGDQCSLIKKSRILQNLSHNKMNDLFSRLNSGIFTSKEADFHNKAAVLRKISFFLLSGEDEMFLSEMTTLIPIVNELIEYPPIVKKEVYNLIAIIFLKFGHNHLSSLFPIFFSEIENDTFIESLRSLEMLMLIASKETVEQRWYVSAFEDENTIIKKKLEELYPNTEIQTFDNILPQTRKILLKDNKKEFLMKAESYYKQLDENIWTIDFAQIHSDVLEWFISN